MIANFLPAKFLREQVKIAIGKYLVAYFDHYSDSLGFARDDKSRFLVRCQVQEIPIKPCYGNYQAHYSCPVVFQLANYLNSFKNSKTIDQLIPEAEQMPERQSSGRSPNITSTLLSPEYIAQNLREQLLIIDHRSTDSTSLIEFQTSAIQQDYEIVAIAGHLNFRLSDRYITDCLCAYLNYLNELNLDCDSYKPNQQSDRNTSGNQKIHTTDRASPQYKQTTKHSIEQAKFPGYTYVQYAYSRCCAVLRIAQYEGLADAISVDFNWPLLEQSNQLNHYDRFRQFPNQSARLLLQTEPELQLIFEILKIGDYFFNVTDRDHQAQPTNHQRQKSAYGLAVSFLKFYEHCPIFGVSPTIAVARIGLFALPQRLIKFLVADLIDLPEHL